MANGQATITFDGVNLDNCIKQGLELTGHAKCPNCKQIYSFQIHLNLQEKLHKYIETIKEGDTVTALAADTYDVSIKFSGNRNLLERSDFSGELEEPEVEPPCVPCSRCTPRCERLGNRW